MTEAMGEIDDTPSMNEMLDWFAEQPCSCATVGHVAAKIGRSRESVRNNLKQLRAAGYAEHRFEPTGEYRLLRDPRPEHGEMPPCPECSENSTGMFTVRSSAGNMDYQCERCGEQWTS
ncbi:hypothetical protein [Halomarina rubra]|uniref:Uncharacterized protein n=1 Tax=Halomarina rubra TaxID=2071873 RepID=A0ABD6B432_9EURY|nr:hypothetical protein [Halomarina rubra]